MKRRAFLGAALAGAAWSARGASPPRSNLDDFDAAWRSIESGYAYFDAASRTRWRRAREELRPLAAKAPSAAAFAAVLVSLVGRLRDDNATISGPAIAARRIPFDLDLWPRWRDGAAIIEAVRTFGDADVAGLHPGQVVTRIQGVPVEAAVREMLGTRPGIPDIEWALRRLLAGPRSGVHRLEVRDMRRLATVELERKPPTPSTTPTILGRRMGEERDIGYVRVRVGAADPELAAHFAGAMGHMSGTRALIVDLRETAGPGSRETTLAVLSRFTAEAAPWQVRQSPGKPRLTDTVGPGPSAYRQPVAVLVDRWTAGEAEALAMGLAAVARAQVIGTEMAGLRGELREVVLAASGLVLRYPAERAFTVSGVPREQARPSMPVDLSAPSGGPGDPILYQALKLFERR